jgi:hypothetical protein
MRRIASFTSSNRRFGPAVTVLGPPQTPDNGRGEAQESKFDFDGTNGWRKIFHSLLEGILRDGEDLAVTISYELVRKTFHKFGHLLDAVTTPRLVVCDIDEDDIVLVSRLDGKPEDKQAEAQKKSSNIKTELDDSPSDPNGETPENLDEDDVPIKVTGLRDWSNCIFGDPLFATVFSCATPEFQRGFGHSVETTTTHVKSEDDNIIEDPDNAATRLLLYECYHATVSVVRQFYRPDADSSEREIAARRRLVVALAKLEHVDVAEPSGKRPRRLSREEWPVKRPRGDMPTPKEKPK